MKTEDTKQLFLKAIFLIGKFNTVLLLMWEFV